MTDLLPPQAGHMPTGNPKADAKAAKAYAKATRPWFKKKRWWLAGAIIVIIGASAASGGEVENAADSAPSQSSDTGKKDQAPSQERSEPTEVTTPDLTPGQENAVAAAENYLSMMPFSRAGLIRQLSSPAGDGYSKADATYAANHVEVDWNEEAAEAAKNYLDLSPFSRAGLIQQLTSAAGDGYTLKQATYGVDKAGL